MFKGSRYLFPSHDFGALQPLVNSGGVPLSSESLGAWSSWGQMALDLVDDRHYNEVPDQGRDRLVGLRKLEDILGLSLCYIYIYIYLYIYIYYILIVIPLFEDAWIYFNMLQLCFL